MVLVVGLQDGSVKVFIRALASRVLDWVCERVRDAACGRFSESSHARTSSIPLRKFFSE